MASRLPLLATALALACASPQPPPAPEQRFGPADAIYGFQYESRAKIAKTFPAIDALASAQVAEGHLPGVAFGIVVDGALVHAAGFGVTDIETRKRPDADTVYRLGSVTKSFTALAILALRDQGKLRLDDPLVRHLPEASGLVYPTRDSQPLTLRQILTHTSGLPQRGDFDFMQAETPVAESTMLGSLAGLAIENPPGMTFLYSNLGYGLLGPVAARVAGVSFRQVMAEQVFWPLHMRATAWDAKDVPPDRLATPYEWKNDRLVRVPAQWKFGAFEGSGGIYSSVRDMARYVAFHLSAYPARDVRERSALRRSSVREAHRGGVLVDLRVDPRAKDEETGRSIEAAATSYGYGWEASRTCDFQWKIQHDGNVDGYSSSVTFLPDFGVGIVALTNVTDSGPLMEFSNRAIAAMLKAGGLKKRVKSSPISDQLKAAMGRLLEVYETWDDAAYKRMLSPGRPVIAEIEKRELAIYRAQHGSCSGFESLTATSAQRGRFRLLCERGELEMEVVLAANGGIAEFRGTMSDVPPPPWLARAVSGVIEMLHEWNDETYQALFASSGPSRATLEGEFGRLRQHYGKCGVPSPLVMEVDRAIFSLKCERGGDLKLLLYHLEVGSEKLNVVAMRPAEPGPCAAVQ